MSKVIKKTTEDGRKYEFMEFGSMAEFYGYLCDTPFNESFRWERHSSVENGAGFTGTRTFDEAVDLMKNGWSEMSTKLTAKLKVDQKVEVYTKEKTVYDVVGFQASVPRYLNGIPTNMVNKQKFPSKQKVITLNKSICYAGHVSTDRIEEESIKAFRIVKKLEAQGYRVNLNVVLGTYEHNGAFGVKVRIKSANERLNISKMSFPMVHPSMLRRLMFRFIEVYPNVPKNFTSGYGRPTENRELKELFMDSKKGEYLLPAFMPRNIDSIKTLEDLEKNI